MASLLDIGVGSASPAHEEVAQKIAKRVAIINEQLSRYQTVEKKDLAVLKRRLAAAKDKAKAALIKDEIYYHQKIIETEKFMQQYEQPMVEFADAFNGLLGTAIERLESGNPVGALPHLELISKKLFQMKPVFEKQVEIEKYLLKLNKRKVDDLKKEKSDEKR